MESLKINKISKSRAKRHLREYQWFYIVSLTAPFLVNLLVMENFDLFPKGRLYHDYEGWIAILILAGWIPLYFTLALIFL